MKNNELDKEMKKSGWSVIADPNSGVKIYDLLLDKNSKVANIFNSLTGNCKPLDRVGIMTKLFENENVALSADSQIAYAADTDYGQDSSNTVNANVGYMKNLFAKVGAGLRGAFDFSKVQKVSFTFLNPERHFQDIDDIAKYIKSGNVVGNHNNYDDLLNNKLYLVYELKLTRSFYAKFFDSKNNDIQIDIEALNNDIDGKLKASALNNIQSEVLFEGDTPIIFAFKAAKILHLGNSYSIFQSKYWKLDKALFSELELRLLYSMIDKLYQNKEDFKTALPKSLNETKKELIVSHFEFENFKLDPTDNLKYLDGNHNLENIGDEVPFVSFGQ